MSGTCHPARVNGWTVSSPTGVTRIVGRWVVIVLWPHARLFDVNRHAPWLQHLVIGLSYLAAAVTIVSVLAVWFRPTGLRCVLAIALALIATQVVSKGIAHVVWVERPFAAHHFKPLFPHVRNTSFPSTLTAYFALVAAPMYFAWRRVGWIMVGVTAEVAAACVYVGVHYGSDVVAGTVIGGGFGVVAWLVLGLPPIAPVVATVDRVLVSIHLRPTPRDPNGAWHPPT